jgi:Lon protease-like protein
MKLPIFPLHTVLFPGMALPLHIFEPRYRRMVNDCLEGTRQFGVALIRAGVEVGGGAVPHVVGTLAHITTVERLPDGRLNIEAVGQERFRILALHDDHEYLSGTVRPFPLDGTDEGAARYSARALAPWLQRYIELLARAAATTIEASALPAEPEALGYLAAMVAQIPMSEKQALLSMTRAADLLRYERTLYRREISLLRAMLATTQPRDTATFSPN